MDLLNGCRLLTCFLIRDKRSLLGLQVTSLQVYIIDPTAVSPSIRNPHYAVRSAKSGIHFSLHFTSLHSTSLHFTSFHFTSLHFTSFHFISLHFTSLFINVRRDLLCQCLWNKVSHCNRNFI